jgi:hypothetical protein
MQTMTLYEYFRPFLLIAFGFLLNEFMHRARDRRRNRLGK